MNRRDDASASPFVIDAGDRDGPAVVLIHGQPGVARDWQPVVDVLTSTSAGFRVLVPDRPGWGSCDEAATGIADNAEWLERALRAHIGEERAIVVGHSFGGGVAIKFALEHPVRTRALVLIASVGREEALSPLDRALAKPVVGEKIVRGGLFAAQRVGRLLKKRLEASERFGDSAGRVDKVALLRVLMGEHTIPERSWRSFLVEQRALVDETPDLQASLPSLHVPTVVMSGLRDRVVPLAASRALAAAIPGAEMVIVPGVGHLLPAEAPEAVAEVVARYHRLTA